MNEKSLKVIVFLSGKGGSGKTTVAIAFAKLLSDIGKKVVLIDFDLSTNGASYFFKTLFGRTQRGFWECLAVAKSRNLDEHLPLPDSIKITEGFQFVASRVSLGEKGLSYDSVSYDKEFLKRNLLEPIIVTANEGGADYVLIDCQAGFAVTSIASSELGDLAILVTEADAVSSDAADNLLIQLGASLPRERRYLVNKIDVRDAETYRQMRNVFQTLNRLPPLPFDFEVRSAFGSRQIPVDVTKPSSLLFALLETVKAALPEIQQDIEVYKKNRVDMLFEQYDKQLNTLLNERQSLEAQLAETRATEATNRRRLATFASLGLAAISMLAATYFAASSLIPIDGGKYFAGVAGVVVSVLATVGSLLYRRQIDSRLAVEQSQSQLQSRLTSVTQEVDKYRSLLLVKSRDYLLDIEIAKAPVVNHEH